MVLSPKKANPKGGTLQSSKTSVLAASIVDTYDSKIHVEWDPDAAVTPLGQLPFFIQFLKIGGRFDPWVNECPLVFSSDNAPKKVDVLGSLFLSILSGHKRYAHITSLMSDGVNPALLGMNKIVSEDSARRAVKKLTERRASHGYKIICTIVAPPIKNAVDFGYWYHRQTTLWSSRSGDQWESWQVSYGVSSTIWHF